MRIPKPKFMHPTLVYQAIIAEHRNSEVKMAERLQSCGWTLADAAWAAVNWDLHTLAAAVANERAARDMKLTNLSDGGLAKLRAEIEAAQEPPRPKRTTRIMQIAPKLPPQFPQRTDEPKAR